MLLGTSQAQESVSLGVKGGLNIANVYDSQAENFSADPKLGYAVGGFLTIPLSGALAIQPEVVYSQKGYSATSTTIKSSYKLAYTFNYIDVPLLVVLRMSEGIHIVVGPQINFLLSSTSKFKSGNLSDKTKTDYNDGWRKNTIAGHLGFDFNFGKLLISPRYSIDLQDNNGKGVATNPRFKNMFLQLTIGYRLM